MAIYYLDARGVAPSRGSSSVAAAAYQSGERLRDERTGDLKAYSRAERVASTGIELPDGAPALDREGLWNLAEAAWPGGPELTAKRYVIALPRELDAETNIGVVREFCGLFPDRARDWAIHDDGDGNPHAHVLVSALALDESGFVRPKAQKSSKIYLCRDAQGEDVMVASKDWKAAKAAGIEKVFNFKDGRRLTMSEAKAEGLGNDDRKSRAPVSVTAAPDGGRAFDAEKAELKRIRASWAEIANRALAAHAAATGEKAVEIDHRSYSDRGIARIPMIHEGSRPEPWIVAENAKIRALNGVLETAVARVTAQLAALKRAAGAWFARKGDALAERRRAFIERQRARAMAVAAAKGKRKRSEHGDDFADQELDWEYAGLDDLFAFKADEASAANSGGRGRGLDGVPRWKPGAR